jgi:hypothetical protein
MRSYDWKAKSALSDSLIMPTVLTGKQPESQLGFNILS